MWGLGSVISMLEQMADDLRVSVFEDLLKDDLVKVESVLVSISDG